MKTMKNHKDDLKTVWETNFLYMDMTISKRGITLEPLSWTAQNNFHVDDLKTVVKELDRKMAT